MNHQNTSLRIKQTDAQTVDTASAKKVKRHLERVHLVGQLMHKHKQTLKLVIMQHHISWSRHKTTNLISSTTSNAP